MEHPAESPRIDAAAWIGRHQTSAWRYARYLGCPAERASDLVQDALIAALEHGISALGDERSRGWLRTTVRNLYFMELRSARRRPSMRSLERLDAEWLEHEPADDHAWLAALDACVDGLEARAKLAIAMRYRDGASRTEIARTLGLREAGVKTLLRRVREALRRCIERRVAPDEGERA